MAQSALIALVPFYFTLALALIAPRNQKRSSARPFYIPHVLAKELSNTMQDIIADITPVPPAYFPSSGTTKVAIPTSSRTVYKSWS